MADENDRPSGEHEDPTTPRPEPEWTSSDATDPFARPAGSRPGDNPTEPVPRNPTQPVPPPPGQGQGQGQAPGQGPAYGQGQPPGQGPAYGQTPGQGPSGGGSYGPPPPGSDPYRPPSGAPSYGSPAPYGGPGAGPGYGSPYGQNQPSGPYGQPPDGSGPAYGSPYGQPQPSTTNVSAIILTILSGLSMLFCAVTQLPALIFGIIALSRMSDDPEGSRRMSRYGWIAFAIGILVIILFIVGIIAIVAATDGGSSDYRYNTY